MTTNDYSQLVVVVIDDDTMVLRSLEKALSDIGFKIIAFSDPLKGLEWIDKNGADIVISDICMPQCDGFGVLKRIKEKDPQCDVIFITAHGQMDIAIRALREGATDFFEKPLAASSLQAAVERTWRYRMLAQQKKVLSEQVEILKNELKAREWSAGIMLGKSDAMKKVACDTVDLANSNVTVLITGESGTGKELVAKAIHSMSQRAAGPFLIVNCPSIPDDLFESEMFGHRKGAFTGAIETRGGYVEAASEGTLFLDEIGDMPIKVQSKILRLLEQKTYLPIGEQREKPADIRIIAATNQPLEQIVKEKKFREDLYYRLKVCTIELPPLRGRKSDIPILALYFTLHFAEEMNKNLDGISDEAMNLLMDFDYPGNIRELRNIIESSVIHCKHEGQLKKEDLPPLTSAVSVTTERQGWPAGSLKFHDVERQLYEEALNRAGNNISAASRLLGLSRGKFRRRLEALNIKNPSS